MQYRKQILPMITIAVGIALPYIFHGFRWLFYPALAIAIGGIIWDMWIMGNYRQRDRISAPEPDDIVAPIEGKIKFVRANQDITLVNIYKSFLDVVEIRCPHAKAILEDEMLKLHLDMGTVTFRFNAENIIWFDDPEFTAGSVLGMIYGPGTCSVSLPTGMETALRADALVHAGQTMITTVKGEPRSITVG